MFLFSSLVINFRLKPVKLSNIKKNAFSPWLELIKIIVLDDAFYEDGSHLIDLLHYMLFVFACLMRVTTIRASFFMYWHYDSAILAFFLSST